MLDNYTLIIEYDVERLNERVNARLNFGYKLYGSPTSFLHHWSDGSASQAFAQAVVYEKEEGDE